MKTTPNILRRIPLTPKLVFLTLIVGAIVWGILDYAQSKIIRTLIEERVARKLAEQSHDDRMHFDSHLGAFQSAVSLIASQKKFLDYVSNRLGTGKGKGIMKLYTKVPPWLPDASIMRRFAHIHYAFLIDGSGQVRELYQGWPEPPPPPLLRPSALLLKMSRNQSFMTDLDGLPFLLTSEAVTDEKGQPLATVLLAVILNDDFFISMQGLTSKQENLMALADGEKPRIIASNRPDLLKVGTSLETLKQDYLVTGQSFFDWGSSDLTIQFISFISKEEFERLNASILAAERLQRAIMSLSFILVFAIIMFWISRHIKNLSRSITNFSQEVLGIRHQTVQRGDELFLIEAQFGNMTEEIVNIRETLKREAEEKVVLLRKAMEVERQEQELKLLQALKLSEENYHSIFDSANDAIIVLDMQTDAILEVNRKMTEMYGYTAEEAKTLTMGKLSMGEYPYNQDGAMEFISKAVSNEPQLFEWLAKDRFGRTFWVEVNLKRVDAGGRDRLLAIERDISERKRTEQRLAVQYKVTRILAEAATFGEATPKLLQSICEHVGRDFSEVWLVDTDSSTLRWGGVWHVPSPDLTDFTAYSRKLSFERGRGLPGRVWANNRPVWISDVEDVLTEKDFPRAAATKAAGLHAGFAFPIRGDGEVIGVMDFLSRSVQPPDDDLIRMFDALGSQIGDFIKRKKAEEDMRRYFSELERSNKELQMFASIASHDLQEPLHVVSGFSQLLERRYKGKLDKSADEFIGFIVEATNRMQQLIRDLLDYSRVTTRGKPFKSVDSTVVVGKALMNLKTAIDESSALITFDALPVLTGDESQLMRLFQNLIGNAIKYRRKDTTPRIHISAKKLDDPAVHSALRTPHSGLETGWLFSVQDNGIGIEERHFDRIFQVFQRLHKRGEYPGTGIGLAICQKIVERHGGSIWVKSEIGMGSTFLFTIPEQTDKEDIPDPAMKEGKATA